MSIDTKKALTLLRAARELIDEYADLVQDARDPLCDLMAFTQLSWITEDTDATEWNDADLMETWIKKGETFAGSDQDVYSQVCDLIDEQEIARR